MIIGSVVSVLFDTVGFLKAICGGGVIPGAVVTGILVLVLSRIFPADYSDVEDITVKAVTDV